MIRSLLLSSLAVTVVACGSSAPDAPDASGTPVDAAPDAAAPGDAAAPTDAGPPRDAGPPGPTASLTAGPYRLEPGDERTECVVLELDNATPRTVRAIRTTLTQGSHHMIIYRTDQPVMTTPTPCFPFADGGSALYIAESPMDELVFPEGAGLEFAARQHIRIEVHQVNYYGMPIDVSGSVEFEFYDEGVTGLSPVQLLFTGDMGISIPARAMGYEITSFFTVPSGARIFGLTSHTHSLGTLSTIHRARSETDLVEQLHQSDSWADPPLDVFSPPLTMASGEGLRLLCRYDNPGATPVGFGLGFEDEMCFLWAYYY